MGAPILSGISGAASVAGLFGTPSGANESIYGRVGQGTSITGTATGVINVIAAHSAAFSGSSVASFAALANPVLLDLMGALVIISHIFHGADPLQVPASQVEQAFEAAADKVYALEKSAYITTEEAVGAIQDILKAGQLYYDQILQSNPAALRDPGPFKRGRQHMTDIINAEIQSAQSVTVLNANPWNPAALVNLYPQAGTHGWYPQSVLAADELIKNLMLHLRPPAKSVVSTNVFGRSNLRIGKDKIFVGALLGVGFLTLKFLG